MNALYNLICEIMKSDKRIMDFAFPPIAIERMLCVIWIHTTDPTLAFFAVVWFKLEEN